MSLELKLKTKFSETYSSYSPTSAKQSYRILSSKSPTRNNKDQYQQYNNLLNKALKNTEKISSTRLVRREDQQLNKNSIYNQQFDNLQDNQTQYFKNLQQKRCKSPISRIQQDQETRHFEYQFLKQYYQKNIKHDPVLTITQYEYPIIANQQTIDAFRLDVMRDVNKLANFVKRINDQIDSIVKQQAIKDPYTRLQKVKYIKYLVDNLNQQSEEKNLPQIQEIIIDLLKNRKEQQQQMDSIASCIFDLLSEFEQRATELINQYFNEQQYVDELLYTHRNNIRILVIDEQTDNEHFILEKLKEKQTREQTILKYNQILNTLVPGIKKHIVYDKVIKINQSYIQQIEQCNKFLELEQLVQNNKTKLDICYYHMEM